MVQPVPRALALGFIPPSLIRDLNLASLHVVPLHPGLYATVPCRGHKPGFASLFIQYRSENDCAAGPAGTFSRHNRVLLADDSKMMRRLLVKFLTKLDIEVDEAENGLVALEMLRWAYDRKCPYDLALIDVKMPQVDGFEMLETVRSDVDLGDTPAVIITSESERALISRFVELGISGYILKPVKMSALREAVSKIITI